MKIIILFIASTFFQTSGSVTKNNGEVIQLTNIEIYQDQEGTSSSSLSYSYRGKMEQMSVDDLKRITLKESVGKKKGVITWKALLVTQSNQKLEVSIDIASVKGVTSNGKEESYSSNAISKISL